MLVNNQILSIVAYIMRNNELQKPMCFLVHWKNLNSYYAFFFKPSNSEYSFCLLKLCFQSKLFLEMILEIPT